MSDPAGEDPEADEAPGDGSVAIGDFQSEADEDAAIRAREETKRLLYVAVTRARDRLYLSSVLKDNRLVPARGSLAEVLPPSMRLILEQGAAASGPTIEWTPSGGGRHVFHVCGLDAIADGALLQEKPGPPPRSAPDDFAPILDDGSVDPVSVVANIGLEAPPDPAHRPGRDSRASAVTGDGPSRHRANRPRFPRIASRRSFAPRRCRSSRTWMRSSPGCPVSSAASRRTRA